MSSKFLISKVLTVLTLGLLASPIYAAPANAETHLVQRVRYCVSGWLYDNKCTKGETSKNFPEWTTHNVDDPRQKQTYISIVSQPEISKVKHVVFVSAGQQVEVSVNPDGYQNVLTGQPADYKKDCLGKTRTCNRNFNDDGLAMRLKNSGRYNMADTLFIMVLDSQYNYYEEDKAEMVDAYWDFLTNKFWPTQVKDIVLAGQSRGGCLSLLLAQRFRSQAAYRDIPLVLQTNDAVCRNDESEIPSINPGSKVFATNPTNPNKGKSILVDIGGLFPTVARKDLYINNIHAGQKVGGLPFRAFTYKPNNVNLGWWRQRWVKYSHTDMGGNFDHKHETVQPALRHILTSLEKIRSRPFRQASYGPVDVNGDGLSDIVIFESEEVRSSAFSVAGFEVQLRVKLSNGDGTFEDVFSTTKSLDDGYADRDMTYGYFTNDRKTDIMMFNRTPIHGLLGSLFASNGDGKFSGKLVVFGDGPAVDEFPVLTGDVNGDGLTDLILRYRDAQRGLVLRTKFAKGDGTFTEKEFALGDGSGVDHLQAFAADVNRDSKTDLILQYQTTKGHFIRTKISNGDGTFTGHEFATGEWLDWNTDQFHIADVNGDRRSDLVRTFQDKTDGLKAHSYLSKGDGTYDVKRFKLGDGEFGYGFPALVADINGDRKTDLVLHYRDSQTNQMKVRTKFSNGDGTFRHVERTLDLPEEADTAWPVIGNFDKGGQEDLAFFGKSFADRYQKSTDAIHVRFGAASGDYRAASHTAPEVDGVGQNATFAISGPVRWSGRGGAFPPCRPPLCPMTAVGATEAITDGVKIDQPMPSNPIQKPVKAEKKTLKRTMGKAIERRP